MRAPLVASLLALLFLAGCGGTPSRIRVLRQVDVSEEAGPQLETAIAVDPRTPQVLLAASNTLTAYSMEYYTSANGGKSWLPVSGPPLSGGYKVASDPGVAIDRTGREFFSYLASKSFERHSLTNRVFVASRSGPERRWRRVGASPADIGADKPALAVDPSSGRVYVSWTLFTRTVYPSIAVAHSDDGGKTWSRPASVVGAGLQQYSTLAVGPDHTVYVAWDDYQLNEIVISRSRSGNAFPAQVKVATYPVRRSLTQRCHGFIIRAEPHNCLHADPSIVVAHGRVIVTWGGKGTNGSQDIFQRVFTPTLKPDGRPHVVAPDGPKPSDQFWPATALDRSTGRVWLCFYDTHGDPSRRKVRYSCTDSADGGTNWAKLARVASLPSDVSIRTGRDDADYGDYEGLAAGHGLAYPVWTDTRKWSLWKEEVFSAVLSP